MIKDVIIRKKLSRISKIVQKRASRKVFQTGNDKSASGKSAAQLLTLAEFETE